MLTSVTVILLKKFATKNIQNLDIHDDNSMMNCLKCSRNARIISLSSVYGKSKPIPTEKNNYVDHLIL